MLFRSVCVPKILEIPMPMESDDLREAVEQLGASIAAAQVAAAIVRNREIISPDTAAVVYKDVRNALSRMSGG